MSFTRQDGTNMPEGGFTALKQRGIIKRPAGASHLPYRPNPNGSYEDHVMAGTPLPSPEVLRQLLRYEPDTGKLFWKERTEDLFTSRHRSPKSYMNGWNAKYAGKQAFTAKHNAGYRSGAIFERLFLAHRVCYAIHFGKWPENHIDHVNGDRADNRIDNLRDVTVSQNRKNVSISGNNSSGFGGVYLQKRTGRWVAETKVSGKKIYIGSFPDKDLAIAARMKANADLGFSSRHGV